VEISILKSYKVLRNLTVCCITPDIRLTKRPLISYTIPINFPEGKIIGKKNLILLFRLTVLLAGFRYVFLSCKTLTAYVSTPDRALIGVSAVVVVSTILCIPSYVEHSIVENSMNETDVLTANDTNLSKSYRFEQTRLSRYLSLRETVFVLHSVIFKLIPCFLLLLFSFLLIQQLRDALAKSEKLQHHSATSASTTNNGRIRGRRRENENRRTTLMLVIVCVLFLVTELPQGAILLLTFISSTNSKHYFQIYQQLGILKFLFS
jgi:hypothetical protein